MKIYLLLFLLALTSFAPPKVKLVPTKLSKELTVGVPADFVTMPDAGIAQKYPAARKPVAVYTNASGRVDYSISVRPTTFESMDYGVLIKIYKASIQRLYSKVEFIKEDIRTVNGRDYVAFEFISTVIDNNRITRMPPVRRYQYIQYAIKDNNVLIFSFIAPAEEQAQWQPTAHAVMDALDLK